MLWAFSDRFFFSEKQQWDGNHDDGIFISRSLKKVCQNAALTRVQTKPPPREAKISPSFSFGFFLRTETRWLSNKNHPKDVSIVRGFFGDVFLQL